MNDRQARTVKDFLYDMMETGHRHGALHRRYDKLMMALITLNIMAVITGTIEHVYLRHEVFFDLFEAVSVLVFSAEYVLHLWVCTGDPKYARPVSGRLRYLFTPMALVDLASVLPYYLPLLVGLDLRFLRGIRLFRIFKMGHYSEALKTFGAVVGGKKAELAMAVFIVFILLIMASSGMYFIERDVQPKVFSSIPAAMWWGVTTLTTVGYGDVYPVTVMGKIFGAVIAILGIGLFALPTGILASGFTEHIEQVKEKKRKRCPHCGEALE